MPSKHESINQFIYVNTWDGVALIIQARAESGVQGPKHQIIARFFTRLIFLFI